MPFSVGVMRKLEVLEPSMKDVLWTILDEIEQHREAEVTKREFNQLTKIVEELAVAQSRSEVRLARTEQKLVGVEQALETLAAAQTKTEQRLERTEQVLETLAAAQTKTEQRLERIEQVLETLAAAQTKTEQRLDRIEEILETLAAAQTKTEQRVESLAAAQTKTEQRLDRTEQLLENLIKAQSRTEQRMESLAKAQEELAVAQKNTEAEVAKLANSLAGTRSQVGGLSRSMSYALENDAFRQLPKYLKTHCQLEVKEHFVRTFIGGEEINVFAKAKRNGEEVLVVGETVLRLDDRSKMGQLEKNVKAVKAQFKQEVIPLMITHIALPAILEKAQKEGVLVIQSFEWE
jgi:myosin heavy subunit